MEPQLLADHAVVPLRVARGTVDDVDEDPRPLDVAQEGVPEAGAGRRTLDEPGDVGDRGAAVLRVPEVHHPEVRLQRGERVRRDLRPRRGQRCQEGRLPGVRQPDEADVGDQPQLQAQPALLARLALLGVLRRAMRGRREVDVAEPAASAARDRRRLAGRDQVGEQLARRVVQHARPGRHLQHEVLAGLPVPLRARAPAAWLGLEVVLEAEVEERREAGVDAEHDAPAAAAVAAVGPAPRDVGLPAERRGPIAAVSGADPDLDEVEEHGSDCRTGTGDRPRAPPGRRSRARGRPAG